MLILHKCLLIIDKCGHARAQFLRSFLQQPYLGCILCFLHYSTTEQSSYSPNKCIRCFPEGFTLKARLPCIKSHISRSGHPYSSLIWGYSSAGKFKLVAHYKLQALSKFEQTTYPHHISLSVCSTVNNALLRSVMTSGYCHMLALPHPMGYHYDLHWRWKTTNTTSECSFARQ